MSVRAAVVKPVRMVVPCVGQIRSSAQNCISPARSARARRLSLASVIESMAPRSRCVLPPPRQENAVMRGQAEKKQEQVRPDGRLGRPDKGGKGRTGTD